MEVSDLDTLGFLIGAICLLAFFGFVIYLVFCLAAGIAVEIWEDIKSWF